jgi:hypothetical protein
MKTLETSSGELVVPSGASEANALGLTTQVPTRDVYLTSGPSRKFKFGNREVELKHGNRSQLLLGKSPAGRAIRALIWLGPEQTTPIALATLKDKLSTQEWEAMRQARARLPSWMALVVSSIEKFQTQK